MNAVEGSGRRSRVWSRRWVGLGAVLVGVAGAVYGLAPVSAHASGPKPVSLTNKSDLSLYYVTRNTNSGPGQWSGAYTDLIPADSGPAAVGGITYRESIFGDHPVYNARYGATLRNGTPIVVDLKLDTKGAKTGAGASCYVRYYDERPVSGYACHGERHSDWDGDRWEFTVLGRSS